MVDLEQSFEWNELTDVELIWNDVTFIGWIDGCPGKFGLCSETALKQPPNCSEIEVNPFWDLPDIALKLMVSSWFDIDPELVWNCFEAAR